MTNEAGLEFEHLGEAAVPVRKELDIVNLIVEAARSYAALPKLQKVDLDEYLKDLASLLGSRYDIGYGYNSAIADIKSKYGELYAEVKE